MAVLDGTRCTGRQSEKDRIALWGTVFLVFGYETLKLDRPRSIFSIDPTAIADPEKLLGIS